MDEVAAKSTLKRYLDVARDLLLWKLEGLSECDVRRPLTPTASLVLGMVKHVASVENGYLGEVFARPWGESLPWYDEDAEANADMWVTAEETREDILGLYERTRAHSDGTIEALSLDSVGEVLWWPEDRRRVTLHQILVHITTETHRHAGHADISRELIDGAADSGPRLPTSPIATPSGGRRIAPRSKPLRRRLPSEHHEPLPRPPSSLRPQGVALGLDASAGSWPRPPATKHRCRNQQEVGHRSVGALGGSGAGDRNYGQNMPLSFAEVSGTACSTSQCSTTLPAGSMRKMSIPA
jgi:hypothetical protein